MKKLLLLLGVTFALLEGCSLTEPAPDESSARFLKPLHTYELTVAEPSGLSLNADNTFLWTVSDQTNHVYKMTLTGQVVDTLRYEGYDLEGITFDSARQVLWVAEEHSRELVKLDLKGNELERHRILEGFDNSGLEGLCIDREHNFFTIKEKSPGLFLALNPDFSIKRQIELTFDDDNSGLWADTLQNRFWILSDQSQSFYLWSPDKGVIRQFKIPVKKPEGIAIDFQNALVYIVSDAESKLYVFALPGESAR